LFNLKKKQKQKKTKIKESNKKRKRQKEKEKKPRTRNPAPTIPLDFRSLLAAGNRNPTRERKERGKLGSSFSEQAEKRSRHPKRHATRAFFLCET